MNLLGNGLLTLLRKPDVFDRLRSQPELMPTAVEEMLRLEPPVQFIRRTALDDLDVALGIAVPRSDHTGPSRCGPTH